MTFIEDTTETQRLLRHTYKLIRDRLEHPCNAVPDEPIDLPGRMKKLGFRDWPYERHPEPVKIVVEPTREAAPVIELTAPVIKLYPSILDRPPGKRDGKYPPSFTTHIKRKVAAEFDVSVIDIDSARRSTNYVIPRHAAIFICKELTLLSMPAIGRLFGGRDHATSFNAVKKMPRRMYADSLLCQRVVELKMAIETDLEQWRNATP